VKSGTLVPSLSMVEVAAICGCRVHDRGHRAAGKSAASGR
jgi:hypothetical protein